VCYDLIRASREEIFLFHPPRVCLLHVKLLFQVSNYFKLNMAEKLKADIEDVDKMLQEVGDFALLCSTPLQAEDRRIARRIDFWCVCIKNFRTKKLAYRLVSLLPVMLITYMLLFIDKQAMSYSAILKLPEDLHLVGQQYSWAASTFNFRSLIAAYPGSLLRRVFLLGNS